jgi:hypothetical protein
MICDTVLLYGCITSIVLQVMILNFKNDMQMMNNRNDKCLPEIGHFNKEKQKLFSWARTGFFFCICISILFSLSECLVPSLCLSISLSCETFCFAFYSFRFCLFTSLLFYLELSFQHHIGQNNNWPDSHFMEQASGRS